MIYTLTLNPAIDHHVRVKRLLRQDKVCAQETHLDPGGKGLNVTRVISALGGNSRAFAPVGGHTGELLKEMLNERGMDHCLWLINGGTRTNIKISILDGELVQINGPGPKLTADQVKKIIAGIDTAQPRPSFWVLSGSIPPGVTNDIYKNLITRLQKRGERCVLDADGEALKQGIKAKPFLLKPNQFELQRLIGRTCKSRLQILTAIRSLASMAEIVVVTWAEKGAFVASHGDVWHVMGPSVRVKSAVGAGDAFLAGMLFALDRGEDVPSASRWAVATAAASINREGTANVKAQDVKKFLQQVNLKKCTGVR